VSAPARAQWGWHRLTDGWAQHLVEHAGIRAGDLVLDVGAGTGALTGPLVGVGALVIAVELHPGRARQLRETFAGQPVKVVQVDAADLHLPGRPFRVVANPPFAVTSALLRRLVSPRSLLLSADLVVPAVVGRRWAERTRRPARRAEAFTIAVTAAVPRSAFSPRAPVDIVLLAVRRR